MILWTDSPLQFLHVKAYMSRSTVLISYMPVVDPNWGCGSFQRFTVQEEDMHRSWNILKLLPFGDQHSWLWCNMTIDFNLWWNKWIWQPVIQINGEASANVLMSPTGTSLCGRVCVCVCVPVHLYLTCCCSKPHHILVSACSRTSGGCHDSHFLKKILYWLFYSALHCLLTPVHNS